MDAFPHHYTVKASGKTEGTVELTSAGVAPLATAPPREFGGPGDEWSPETLVVGAVADCFILSFRAIARASKLDWTELTCEAEGTLDRVDRVTRFTHLIVRPRLVVPAGTDVAKAERILEKAEHSCLVTNSLHATSTLEPEVVLEG